MTQRKNKRFTKETLLSDFEVFREVHGRLFDWFVEFDRKCFSKYFSDKYDLIDIIIPPDEDDFWRDTNSRACCSRKSGPIEFEPDYIVNGLEDDIKYTLLHEMIHLFIDCVYPRGDRHTHNSDVFLEWSFLLRCPIFGVENPYPGRKKTSVCVFCGRKERRTIGPKVFNT
jgi:hypothetical protein